MEEQLVSFKTAMLAVKIGFPQETDWFYRISTGEILLSSEKLFEEEGYIAMPTQSQLQRYLREEHEILVIPDYDINNDKYFYWIMLKDTGTRFHTKQIQDREYFSTYEDALEEGLKDGGL